MAGWDTLADEDELSEVDHPPGCTCGCDWSDLNPDGDADWSWGRTSPDIVPLWRPVSSID